jgi:chromosome segregation ATPase
VRGKKGNAAARRREVADLEQRAVVAERRAEKLAAELTEARETSARTIKALRAELAEVKRQRDRGAHPKLQEADEAKRELYRRLGLAEGELSAWRECVAALREQVVSVLRDRAGLSWPEINTVLASIRRLGGATTEPYSAIATLAEFGSTTGDEP